MSTSPSSESVRLSALLRRAGVLAGLILVIAAIIVVIRRREEMAAAFDSIRDPSPLLVAILVGSVAANLALSALTFSLLMSRSSPGRVGLIEMQALICSTALVNYLPMRPGLFGRIAYHRAVNDISILDSTRVLIEGALLTAAAAAALALLALIAHYTPVRLEMLIIMPALLLFGSLWILDWPAKTGVDARSAIARRNSGIRRTLRLFAVAGFIRYTEVLIWAVRYIAAFAIIGSPIEPTVAIGLACVSILATMVPFVSNGLGLREWLVGLLAPVLAGYRLELGLAAELLNRAAEIIVVVMLGLTGMAYLARLRNRRSNVLTSQQINTSTSPAPDRLRGRGQKFDDPPAG